MENTIPSMLEIWAGMKWIIPISFALSSIGMFVIAFISEKRNDTRHAVMCILMAIFFMAAVAAFRPW